MKFNIHYSFLFLIIVGLFASLLKELIIFSLIILLHETSHAITALIFKKKIKRITITIIGGIIEISDNYTSFLKELIINISGILMNFIILLLSLLIKNQYYKELIFDFNLLMIIINILPIYPLDGYRILSDTLFYYFASYKIIKNINFLSMISLILFIVYAIYNKSLGLIMVAIFLIFKNLSLKSQAETFFLKKQVNYYQNKMLANNLKLWYNSLRRDDKK